MSDVATTAHEHAAANLPGMLDRRSAVEEASERRRRERSGGMLRLAALFALMAVIGAGFLLVTYVMDGGSPGLRLPGTPNGSSGTIGSRTDDGWSWYHDERVDEASYGPQWHRDSLGIHPQETYDGPYDYSGYGSTGARARATGGGVADPLYTDMHGAGPDDIFAMARRLDPERDQPVGTHDAWAGIPGSWTSTAYDPYAGYSNPYENRLRMTFADRSRWLDAPGP